MFHSIVALIFFALLYVALFPITYVWFRLIWRVVVVRDYSEVALRKGVAPPDAQRIAPFFVGLNLVAGTILLAVILYVPSAGWDAIDAQAFAQAALADRLGVVLAIPMLAYKATIFNAAIDWVAVAGSTIWIKLMLGWALARHAHLKHDWAAKAQERAAKKQAQQAVADARSGDAGPTD